MTEPAADLPSRHSGADTRIRREGRAGRITLARPKVLNALTYPQVLDIGEALDAFERDPAVRLVILDGAGERGFCAGGDVRALYDSAREGSAFARRFWRDEYHLNARIHRFAKPVVALQDGIVMGGGIGLSAHASHRVVTERSQLAMPETTIGLIPDVGGTWLLSRAPGAIGEFLGLTGHRMNAADAIYAGFSDTMVPSARLGDLVQALAHTQRPVSVVIAALAAGPSDCRLAAAEAEIAPVFAAQSLAGIAKALEARAARGEGTWATARLAELALRSPKAMAATLAAVRAARRLASLEEALEVEYRLTVRLFEDGEFIEGVRALIVDKDKAPRWKPATIVALAETSIGMLLAPLPPGEGLGLAAPA
jgi:enoyl-CoA hydratase